MVTQPQRRVDRARWWEIHDRESYICPDCGRGCGDVIRWEVHHINREAGKCVALCQTCHKVRHGAVRRRINLQAWKEEFTALGSP